MSYAINNIPLSDFGIIPSQHNNSNIALSGWLDMPARIGKTYHDWGDYNGVEPYVAVEEIFFGGRDIDFIGFVEVKDVIDFDSSLIRLEKLLKESCDLLLFSTPYGEFKVYVKDQVGVNKIGDKFYTINIRFRQSEVELPFNVFSKGFFASGVFPVQYNDVIDDYKNQDYNKFGINGIPFKKLGAFVSKNGAKKNFNIPKSKKQTHVSSGVKEHYQITKSELKKTELELVFVANSILDLTHNINSLRKELSSSGMKTIQIDGRVASCFVTDGFKASKIYQGNNIAIATVVLKINLITKTVFERRVFAQGIFN